MILSPLQTRTFLQEEPLLLQHKLSLDPENPIPRDATGAEVKEQVINFMKNIVFEQDTLANARNFTPGDLEPT